MQIQISMGWVAKWLAHSIFKRDIVGLHPTRAKTIFYRLFSIIMPCSYSTFSGLSIKRTKRRLVTDSGTKCAWVIHEKAVQIHVHNKGQGHCLYVPRVPGNVKKPAQHPGPSCSKLTKSLVNDSLKFTSSDTQIC